jgi:hypothetical protein
MTDRPILELERHHNLPPGQARVAHDTIPEFERRDGETFRHDDRVLRLASALRSVLWFRRIREAPEVALDSRGRMQW